MLWRLGPHDVIGFAPILVASPEDTDLHLPSRSLTSPEPPFRHYPAPPRTQWEVTSMLTLQGQTALSPLPSRRTLTAPQRAVSPGGSP